MIEPIDKSAFFAAGHFDAVLIIDNSEQNTDLFYLTRFYAPDKFAYIMTPQSSVIVTSDLEFERAKKQATVDSVLRINKSAASSAKNNKVPLFIQTLIDFFNENKIKNILVPDNMPVKYADIIRGNGFCVNYKDAPFVPQRSIKTDAEIECIARAVETTESVVERAIDLIATTKIDGDYLKLNGEMFTSEKLKRFIEGELFKLGYISKNTIVAGGLQTYDPHNRGTGPLPANKPIILDVFPRSEETFYYADMTRTVVRGTPQIEVIKMFEAVKEAQQSACIAIKHGVTAREVHSEVCRIFTESGFSTGMIDGYMQGFIHSTGHGLGLDIHEEPRIYDADQQLIAGQVVTVEPGLYYKNFGGVRIEDVVVVQKNGALNLNKLEKKLIFAD